MGRKTGKDEFIGKVSNYGKNRKHIEVTKEERDKFEAMIKSRSAT